MIHLSQWRMCSSLNFYRSISRQRGSFYFHLCLRILLKIKIYHLLQYLSINLVYFDKCSSNGTFAAIWWGNHRDLGRYFGVGRDQSSCSDNFHCFVWRIRAYLQYSLVNFWSLKRKIRFWRELRYLIASEKVQYEKLLKQNVPLIDRQ